MNTPPNKFPQWIDLAKYSTPAEKAAALGAAYDLFWETYEVWPTVAIEQAGIVYLGAYGPKE